jgi:hypothetical protein
MKKIFNLLIVFVFFNGITFANNVQITNLSIVNNGPGLITVKFDLGWDNSWRTNIGPANYDGVWVFFKYKQANGDWTHMVLNGNNNVLPAGFDVFQNPGSNKTGAMIYRESGNLGVGMVSATNVQLGVINTLPYNIDVKGFALEMVYIPPLTTRTFFGDGDGITESAGALHYTDNTATTTSVLPMFCDANAMDDAELETDGIYVYSNDTIQLTNPLGSIDPFPTMKALWCMKYEINQASYRDFLNTLDSQQQVNRTISSPTSATGTGAFTLGGLSRNYIEIVTPASLNTPAVYGCDANNNNIFNEASDGEWVACNYLGWTDVAAFLDWSGLAPMSELQFERICRGNSSAGPNPAVLGEYAWGTNTIFGSNYTISGSGTAAEIASNASPNIGNAAYSITSNNGPLRSGVFATAISNRVTSGATFYGVMEMSGNMPEYCISLGTVAGRSCRYVPNGNGNISPLGNAQLSVGGAGFWPGMEGNSTLTATNTCSGTCEVTASAGIRFRGGSIGDPANALSVSDRSVTFTPSARASNRGGRGILYIR